MESKDIEIIDYLRIIYKRKLLIIVGIVVCIGVKLLMDLRAPHLYRMDAVVRMGSKAVCQPDGSFKIRQCGASELIIKALHDKYRKSKKFSKEYSIQTDVVCDTVRDINLINISILGASKESVEDLETILLEFCDEISMETRQSFEALFSAIKSQKLHSEEISKHVANMVTMYDEYQSDKTIPAKASIDVQKGLLEARALLNKVQSELFYHEGLTKNMKNYDTSILGEVKKSIILKDMKLVVLKVGFLSLVTFSLVAFFIEYIKNLMRIKR